LTARPATAHNTARALNPTPSRVYSQKSGVEPFDVAVDSAGDIYVADFNGSPNAGSVLYYPFGITVAGAVYGTCGSVCNPVPGAAGLAGPAGIALDGRGGVYVADSGNNRVLHFPYNTITARAGTTADTVYGQTSFTTGNANTGGVSATTMFGPYAVAADGR